jgi:phosphoheptose isomerase
VPAVVDAAALMADALAGGGKLLLCGNGGSAADCQHVAAELVSRLSSDFERPALPAIALTTDTSLITGFSNDFGFAGLFERQVEALGRPADVLIAISTSGRSENVLRAVRTARRLGLRTLGLTGEDGPLASEVDRAIVVPTTQTQHVQEALLAIEHVLCDLTERMLFDDEFRPPQRTRRRA